MKKSLSKRLISLLLTAAITVTSLPMDTYAKEPALQNEQTTSEPSEQENAAEGNNLEYELNGGSFVAEYEAPDTYPTEELPGWEEVQKDGYSFDGWYDNPEFTGEKITSVGESGDSETVVLYAKWGDSYYYVDIPDTVVADESELTITGKADGLYADDVIQVSVDSENNWNLKDGTKSLSYGMIEKENGIKLEDDAVIMNLRQEQKNIQKNYICSLQEEVQVPGSYSDALNFNISYESQKYTINYVTNGGYQDDPENPGTLIAIENETHDPGTVLDELPLAIKSGHTFLGWCYDEECTDYVDTRDRLLGNTTLYASFTENQERESHTMATFARAIDVDGSSFTIQVTDKSGELTADQVLAACKLKNLSDSNEDITLNISPAGDNTYTLSKVNGWKEGSSYKLELDDEELYFTGFDKTIREYDISIHKEEVKNVELNQTIKYIPIKDLTDLTVNGKSVQTISVATMTVGMDGSVKSRGSSSTGSFTYTESTLKIGDQIAVYSGDVIPDMNMSVSEGNNVSFFEITGAEGNTYEYRGSDTEDVLFMPDVLPLAADKDQDGDASNQSVTVDIADLTFGEDEMSQKLQLDEDTTVDVGDYLAFYTDAESGTPTYGKITNVLISDGKYIIDYQTVTWEEVQAAMDVYATEPVDGADLISGTNIEEMEKDIETQALDSGFAEDVATQIAEMAVRTDSYEELEKNLQEELGSDVKVSSQTPTESISRSAGGRKVKREIEIGKPQVKANIDTKLKHFEGDLSGVHLALEVSVPLTFHADQFADFELTVTATFEQEVRVDINVDGEAVWKTWGIFPYIADYRVTASLDLYEYTGIGLDINFKSVYANNTHVSEKDKKWRKLAKNVDDIVNELQDMMENGEEYISDKSPLMVSLGNDAEEGEEQKQRGITEEISVAKSLGERYADLLENESDWVEIYKQNIVSNHFRIILVIDLAIDLDFVVKTNLNVSIGMSFWYKNAKRYVFCLHVKGRKATSDTIDLVEEQYELTAYAMGTIGLKAGVRVTLQVGLISTELASVGLSADVGGYVQLWGYLYYELKYTASKGRSTRATGALYLEIGIYLEIKFRAQAFANAFTYTPTLYEAMWPLYTIGEVENVVDFSYDEEDLEYNLKREITTIGLPDTFFTMNYLDLKEGLDDGEYFTKTYEDDSDKYFKITMTNDAFTYDPKTNIISVNPGEEKSVDGEMTITWISQPGTFQTKPFQRTIKLHWDMLRNGYYIGFNSNGGTYIPAINQKYGSEVAAPEDPEKQGYVFKGWYVDEELTIPYTFPETMPDQDAYVYAKWEPGEVTYTVKNYTLGTNGIYVLESAVKEKAITDTTISPVPQEKEGFEKPSSRELKIKADGSSVIEYYYPRNRYSIIYKSDGEIISTDTYQYGTMMPVPAVYKPGYEFAGWIEEGSEEIANVPVEVPAADKVYIASWKPSDGVAYTVKYYVQDPNSDVYRLDNISYLTGKTGERVTAQEGNYDSSRYHLKGTLPSGDIKADGSLELRVYYDLNSYRITYDLSEGAALTEGSASSIEAPIGSKVATALPERSGYIFKGWYTDKECTQYFDNIMPAQDTTLYAQWEVVKVSYTVRHLLKDLEVYDEESAMEGATYTLADEQIFTAPIGKEITPEVKEYIGFTAPEEQTANVEADGSTVVEYYYDRNSYEITFDLENENNEGADGEIGVFYLQYGEKIEFNIKEAGAKIGYRVSGWYTDPEFEEKFTEDTMPARNLKLYPKWEPEEITYSVYHVLRDQSTGAEDWSIYEEFTALADSTIEAPTQMTIEGYTFDEKLAETSYKIDPYDPNITYYYNINSHTVTYHYTSKDGVIDQTKNEEKKYGQDIMGYMPEQSGYAFDGWYTDEACTKPFYGQMPDADLKLYGQMLYGVQGYVVYHYLEGFETGTKTLFAIDNLADISNEEVTPETKNIEGFTAPENETIILTPGAVMDNVVEYVYTRNQYDVTYVMNGGFLEGEYVEKSKVVASSFGMTLYGTNGNVWKNGYTFDGWYTDESLTTPYEGTVVPAEAITLYAKWKADKVGYIVKHYQQNTYNDEYVCKNSQYMEAYTESRVEPEVYTYEGFTSPDIQSVVITVDEQTGDVPIIRYYYERKKHTGTFYMRDGEEPVVKQLKYGSWFQTPYRAGYNFGGWYTDPDYTEIYTGTMPDKDLTLYAKWIAQELSYSLVIYKQSVTGEYTDIVETIRDSAPTDSYITPTLQDYEGFTTPKVNPIRILPNSMNRNEIHYARNIHQITFDLDDGKEPVVKRGYFESGVTAPVPTKKGHTFAGWNPKNVVETMPNEDLTYKASWIKNQYRITFTTNGSNHFEELALSYGDPIDLSKYIPVKEGYRFVGWDQDVPYTMPDRNIHLTAVWAVETYSISYSLNGGSWVDNPKSYTCENKEIELKNPSRTNYIFTGWLEDGASEPSTLAVIASGSVGDKHFTAQWREKQYKIYYDCTVAGDGIDSNNCQLMTYTGITTLPECKSNIEGYTFVGWSKTKSTKGVNPTYDYRDRQKVARLTEEDNKTIKLYPVYKAKEYNVRFNYNSDKLIALSFDAAYGTAVTFPYPNNDERMKKWGYNFDHWEKDQNGGSIYQYSGNKENKSYPLYDTRDVTWSAVWKVNKTATYKPSKSDNSYRVVDGTDVVFKFYTDKDRKEYLDTGDQKVNSDRDYILTLNNISLETILKSKKMDIEVTYDMAKVKGGKAALIVSYVDWSNREHKLTKHSSEIKDGKHTVKCTIKSDDFLNIKYLKLDFTAYSKNQNIYNVSNLKMTTTLSN